MHSQRKFLWFLVFQWISVVHSNLLIPGIMKEEVELVSHAQEYVGFLQSALNGTEVEIRLRCNSEVNAAFEVQFVVRSSPCSKEFFVDKSRFSQVTNLLAFYFNEEHSIPDGYNYNSFWYHKSEVKEYNCKDFNGDWFFETATIQPMEMRNVTRSSTNNNSSKPRTKRQNYPGLNGNSIDGGAKSSLTSWHPVQQLPADAAYLLIVRIAAKNDDLKTDPTPKVVVEAQWRGPYGYLSAIDYPLLHFYGFMSFFYIILAAIWFFVCLKHWKDLLRIQFWIGVVIIVGLLEKSFYYAEYSNLNETGLSYDGLIELAELTSCLKRTLAHILVITVAVGYGVVKPRLGSTLNQVLMVGGLYFLLCAIEGLTRVSMRSTDSMKEKQVAKIPLAFLEVLIAYWVFTSLMTTIRALRVRRNLVKLNLYRHFTNVLAFSLGVSILFMLWSLYVHIVQRCLTGWKELWIDTAFWHVFFCIILVMITILWRPSQNNQRYAFTPLLDDSEDENDADVLYSQEELKFRNLDVSVKTETTKKQPSRIGNELDWIERNIPSSIAEALVDEEEEKEQRALEMSKML
ncbi:hypothetical protein M3Y98_00281200 [Aphelenchoides besseyi]|nr:hypothetical protein M3Y98_00281200 [Aphelenchoides besseyi]KAI6201042.1 hypothetical protein M3Y96_00799200 [Aphelenchoides besseyi]